MCLRRSPPGSEILVKIRVRYGLVPQKIAPWLRKPRKNTGAVWFVRTGRGLRTLLATYCTLTAFQSVGVSNPPLEDSHTKTDVQTSLGSDNLEKHRVWYGLVPQKIAQERSKQTRCQKEGKQPRQQASKSADQAPSKQANERARKQTKKKASMLA